MSIVQTPFARTALPGRTYRRWSDGLTVEVESTDGVLVWGKFTLGDATARIPFIDGQGPASDWQCLMTGAEIVDKVRGDAAAMSAKERAEFAEALRQIAPHEEDLG